jgi:hypothetical protein
MEGITVPAIAGICLALGKALKSSPLKSEWIPLICTVTGGIFGLVAFFATPEIQPGGNVIIAIMAGATAGAGATGIHQFSKMKGEEDNDGEIQD